MIRIMFVCTGNICRSPMAQGMLEKLARERGLGEEIEAESTGIDSWHVGEEVDSRMRQTAASHGIILSHHARKLQPDDLHNYDLLIAMGSGHLRTLRSLARGQGAGTESKLHLFRDFDPALRKSGSGSGKIPDVPDPYYGGPQGFEEVYQIVKRTCNALLDAIEEGQFRSDERRSP